MSKLELFRDIKTGEPVKKRLVSAEKARNNNYLAIQAYDNKIIELTGKELGD